MTPAAGLADDDASAYLAALTDTARDQGALWRELETRATPALLLDLPSTATLLEVGASGAGAALTLEDLVATTRVVASPERAAQLSGLVGERGLSRTHVEVGAARDVIVRCEPVDALLMLDGWLSTYPGEIVRAVKPAGELALLVNGPPGAGVRARRELLRAGFREASIVVPWPSARSTFAWANVDSAAAWSTLLSRWAPGTSSGLAAVAVRASRRAAAAAPSLTRVAVRFAAPTACILCRR